MLRRYENDDLDSLLQVWESATRLAHPFLTDAFLAGERQKIAELYLPQTETWVWLENGRLVGFISMIGNEIGGFFVEPARTRRGVGTALFRHVAAQHGTLEVEVFRENAIGRGFYKSKGFVETARQLHAETGQQLIRLRFVPASDRR